RGRHRPQARPGPGLAGLRRMAGELRPRARGPGRAGTGPARPVVRRSGRALPAPAPAPAPPPPSLLSGPFDRTASGVAHNRRMGGRYGNHRLPDGVTFTLQVTSFEEDVCRPTP